jgi:4-hydroxy-3-polyprenylbenzoate decarboxylase
MPLAGTVLRELAGRGDVEVHCILSAAARTVIAAECDETPEELLACAHHVHDPEDLAAGPASGSWWHDRRCSGMLVVPCSMGTVGALASGATRTLLHRAADVALKESFPLVLVVRESPLSEIHLRNLLRLRKAGAVVMPFSPGFYLRPKTLEDMLRQTCARILDQFGLEHDVRGWDASPRTVTV